MVINSIAGGGEFVPIPGVDGGTLRMSPLMQGASNVINCTGFGDSISATIYFAQDQSG